MPNHSSLKYVLLAAASTGTLLTTGACSSKVQVQRVVYDPPSTIASTQSQQDTPIETLQISTPTPIKSQPAPLSTISQVRESLEAIYDIDAELVASSLQEDPNRIHSLKMIEELDRQHAQTLKSIIERFGWPTREMVGLKAVQGAYIAVQHAGHDPKFQARCLTLIEQQVDLGELPGAFFALMTDRVSLSRGDPQVYGTQMTMAPDDAGVMHAVPSAAIWRIGQLDQRRSALGMPAHSRFVEAIEVAYFESIQQSDSQISSVPTAE